MAYKTVDCVRCGGIGDLEYDDGNVFACRGCNGEGIVEVLDEDAYLARCALGEALAWVVRVAGALADRVVQAKRYEIARMERILREDDELSASARADYEARINRLRTELAQLEGGGV